MNLVNPSLFPLVYGRTKVLTQGGVVGFENFLESCGIGEIAAIPCSEEPEERSGRQRHVQRRSKYSNKFQWLPCEVEFQGEGNDVKITSYINNLHAIHYNNLYGLIERLIGLSVEAWNQVLVYNNINRTPPRIQTFGHEDDPSYPEWAKVDGHQPGYIKESELGEEIFKHIMKHTNEYLKLPDNPRSEWTLSATESRSLDKYLDGRLIPAKDLADFIEWKWRRIRKTLHPEPGVAYSYEDWKIGNVEEAVVTPSESERLWSTPVGHKWYTVDLAKTWREKGLQIIIKLASIELTPEKPTYEGGSWHLEGMLNEHIVATSLYYYDVYNTTESRIHFRQEAELDEMGFLYG